MEVLEFVARLSLAFGLGIVIGLERQWRGKSAGLRTNTLVAVGSALFVLLSFALTAGGGDATRIVGQIVTGIGFLGAGVIMKSGLNVHGLNTAATIWCSAAVGCLAGTGLWWQALVGTGFISLIHLLLRPLASWMNSRNFEHEEQGPYVYGLEIRCREEVENHLRVLLLSAIRAQRKLQLRSLKSSHDEQKTYAFIEATLLANAKLDDAVENLAGKLTLEYGVTLVNWQVNPMESQEQLPGG